MPEPVTAELEAPLLASAQEVALQLKEVPQEEWPKLLAKWAQRITDRKESEIEWRDIAIWLADCHAATAEHDGTLRSTSRSRRARFHSICLDAAHMLHLGRFFKEARPLERVLERLRDAAKESR